MSKFLDLNGLSHYNEKIKEVIEDKKGVHLFPYIYDVEYDNVDFDGDIVSQLRKAIDDNKLIVVKGDSGVVPCSYVYNLPEDEIKAGATLVHLIGSLTKIDDSIVTTVSFEMTLTIPEGGGVKLNNKVTTVSYDISEKEICVIEYPLADIGNNTMQIPYYKGDEIINAAINNKPIYVKIKNSASSYISYLGNVILNDRTEQYKDVLIKCLFGYTINNNSLITTEHILVVNNERRTDINNSKSDYIIELLYDQNKTLNVSDCITNIKTTSEASYIKLTLDKKGGTTSEVTIPAATKKIAGLMSVEDKAKLDSLDNELFVLKSELPEIGNLSLDELTTRGLNLNKIYVVPSSNEVEGDIYEEYIIRNESADNEGSFFWERLGSGKAETDLREYEPSIPTIQITYSGTYPNNDLSCSATLDELISYANGKKSKILLQFYIQGKFIASTFNTKLYANINDLGETVIDLHYSYHGSSELRYSKNYFEKGTIIKTSDYEFTSTCECIDLSNFMPVETLILNNGDAITEEHKKLFNDAYANKIDLNVIINGISGFKVYKYSTYAETGLEVTFGQTSYSSNSIVFHIRTCNINPDTSSENYVYSFPSNDYSISFPTGTLSGGKYLNDLGDFEDPFNTINLNRASGSLSIHEDVLYKIKDIYDRGARKYIVSYGGQYSGFGWGTKIQQTTDAAEDTHYILRVYDTDVATRTKPVILEIDVNATAKTVSYTEIPIITGNDNVIISEVANNGVYVWDYDALPIADTEEMSVAMFKPLIKAHVSGVPCFMKYGNNTYPLSITTDTVYWYVRGYVFDNDTSLPSYDIAYDVLNYNDNDTVEIFVASKTLHVITTDNTITNTEIDDLFK